VALASDTAAAPMTLASISAIANSIAGTWPTYVPSPAATPPASVKWPTSGRPAKVAAQNAIIATAPTMTGW